MLDNATALRRLMQSENFTKLMATIKKYTWKLCRDIETSQGDFTGCNGRFAQYVDKILPHQWNHFTLPIMRGVSNTLVPTFILPIPRILTRGGEKSLVTLFFGVVMTITLLAFTAFSVVALVTYEKELNAQNTLIVPGALFILKSVIPKLVEFSVKLEEWDDPEYEVSLIMLRTYFLKLANIFVLYNQLNSVVVDPASNTENRCSESVGGMMFFQLVVSNSILISPPTLENFTNHWLASSILLI